MNSFPLWKAMACLALVAGAAMADTKVDAKSWTYGPSDQATSASAGKTTQQQIEALTPDQKARFDLERSRILARIGRGPDGKLLARNDEKAIKHHRRHGHHGRTHLAKLHRRKGMKKSEGLAKADKKIGEPAALGSPLPDKPVDKVEKTDTIEKAK